MKRQLLDTTLYVDVLAIRQEIKDLKLKIEHTKNVLKENDSKLFKYKRAISAFEHVLENDSYKEMNEGVIKDEEFEKQSIGELNGS